MSILISHDRQVVGINGPWLVTAHASTFISDPRSHVTDDGQERHSLLIIVSTWSQVPSIRV